MPRLTKLYTRKGDDGKTALGSGKLVPKDAPRVSAYGTVDELNAVLGLAEAHGLSTTTAEAVRRIQNELFHLGADLSFPRDAQNGADVPRIEPRHVEALEELIDTTSAAIGPLANFILPGGSVAAGYLHLARTVCRRAERLVVSLEQTDTVGEAAVPYLNRLSDALFALARYENLQQGIDEPLWDTHA